MRGIFPVRQNYTKVYSLHYALYLAFIMQLELETYIKIKDSLVCVNVYVCDCMGSLLLHEDEMCAKQI